MTELRKRDRGRGEPDSAENTSDKVRGGSPGPGEVPASVRDVAHRSLLGVVAGGRGALAK